MDVVLYTFTKRRNSTARPTGGTTYSGQLRESCSTSAPSIGFDFGQNSSPAQNNYAMIPAFDDRYYWIESWTWDAGLWWANMRVDVLASWKNTIGASTNYVLRAAADSNGEIVDTLYPATVEHYKADVDIVPEWFGIHGPEAGYYVIGVVNSAGYQSAVGATSYYALNPRQFRDFMYQMLSTTGWTGASFDANTGLSLDGLTESTFKALFNPFQYVVSCVWVPVNPPAGEAVSSIPLGWWSINASAYPVTAATKNYNFTVDLPRHPQQARGAYLNSAPFTRLTINLNPFGSYPLDASKYQSGKARIYVTMDFVQGKGVLRVFDGVVDPGKDLDVYAVEQIGVPIQLAQVTQDIIGAGAAAGGGLLGTISNAIFGNVGGAIQSAASGVASAAQSLAPQVRTSGANGSWSSYGFASWIQGDFVLIVDEDNTELGRPLCERRQLSTLPGYQLIASPDVPARATAAELDEILSFLSSGYFYE